MPLLFSLQQPLSALRSSLLETFAGQELTTLEIYEQHSVDRPFIMRNYQEVLRQMEDDGIIQVRSLKTGRRPKGSFAGHLLVRFPQRGAMGDKSSIEWTEATWNPIVGCTVISPGCTHCYAMRMARRLEAMGQPKYAGTTRMSGGRPNDLCQLDVRSP